MGEIALRFVQGGLESSKGTAANAARILLARITNPKFEYPREFPEDDRGTLVAASRFYDGVFSGGFTLEQEATFEEFGWFAATMIKGSVAASTVNGSKVYTYTPQTTAGGDTLQAATVEFGDDTQEYESTYCEATSFELGFDTLKVGEAAPVNLSVEYLTQSISSNTKTAGLTVPTVETMLATSASFYLGSTSTGYGSLTALTGSLRSFSLKYDNQLAAKVYVGDGQTYSNIGRGRRIVTFDAMVEGNSDGVTRFTEWKLGTEKRMRLEFNGSIISGSSPATTKKLRIDGRFVLTSFDPLQAVDTNTVYAIGGRFMPDTALSDAEIQFTLVNDVASYA